MFINLFFYFLVPASIYHVFHIIIKKRLQAFVYNDYDM